MYGYLLHEQNTRASTQANGSHGGYEYGQAYEPELEYGRVDENREDLLVGVYKFIILSYFVFAYTYGSECCHFVGYLFTLVLLFLGARLKII